MILPFAFSSIYGQPISRSGKCSGDSPDACLKIQDIGGFRLFWPGFGIIFESADALHDKPDIAVFLL